MPTNIVVLAMQHGKKFVYQVNPDGGENYNKDHKTTRSFIRAFNIAVLESKKAGQLIKYLTIEAPAEVVESMKKAPTAEPEKK